MSRKQTMQAPSGYPTYSNMQSAAGSRFQTNNLQKSQSNQPSQNVLANSNPNNSFYNQSSSLANNVNGNLLTQQNTVQYQNKKAIDSNYQKLNKQSTMLYLHHHQGTGIVQQAIGSSLNNQEAPEQKNNSSFITNSTRIGIESSLNMSRQVGQLINPLKELPIQEKENVTQQLRQESNQVHPSSFISNYQRKSSKPNEKGGLIIRKNSQEKLSNNGQPPTYSYPQENLHKNRPQTSYRIATKNTFQNVNNQMQNNNNINNNGGISNGGGIALSQNFQQMQMKGQNVAAVGCCQNNKENDGILGNTSNGNNAFQLGTQQQINTQKQIENVQQFSQLLNKQSKRSKEVPLDQTEIEREAAHVNINYGEDIDAYQRELEVQYNTTNCLIKHKITPALRSRMIDWMIEVLTNFKCDDQTFFLSVSILDRFFKGKIDPREIQDLHIIGVTSMFIASKYEDIYPLKMKMVYEKIAHKKLTIEKIKSLEMDILKVINYRIPAPTSNDFLKVYLKEVLNIGISGKTQALKYEKKEQSSNNSTNASSSCEVQANSTINQQQSIIGTNSTANNNNNEKLLIEKMSLYLAKMALHDYELSGKKPSLQAVGALYVALKICEQLKKTQLITNDIVFKLVSISKAKEEEIIEVSQRVLYLAQNFEKVFPGLENLKKTHFVNITQLI